MPEIIQHTAGPYIENCWIIGSHFSKTALILDPGFSADRINEILHDNEWQPKAILATHAHPDHIAAAAAVQEKHPIPFYLHPNEQAILDSLAVMSQMLGIGTGEKPQHIHWIKDNETLQFEDLKCKVIEIPGHSPGAVGFLMGKHLFCGDTLFNASVGRTDLPGGNWDRLQNSLQKLLDLPADTIVYPGHGEKTSIGRERDSNPYLRGLTG